MDSAKIVAAAMDLKELKCHATKLHWFRENIRTSTLKVCEGFAFSRELWAVEARLLQDAIQKAAVNAAAKMEEKNKKDIEEAQAKLELIILEEVEKNQAAG